MGLCFLAWSRIVLNKACSRESTGSTRNGDTVFIDVLEELVVLRRRRRSLNLMVCGSRVIVVPSIE